MSVLSFLSAFMHYDKTYSSNFKFLPMTTPTGFCCLNVTLCQIFTSPKFENNVSCLCPKNRKWYLS